MVGLTAEQRSQLTVVRRNITRLWRTRMDDEINPEIYDDLYDAHVELRCAYCDSFMEADGVPDPSYLRFFDEYQEKLHQIHEAMERRRNQGNEDRNDGQNENRQRNFDNEHNRSPFDSDTESEESEAETIIDNKKMPHNHAHSCHCDANIRSEDLLKFDGARLSWTAFRNSFEMEVINNEAISKAKARSLLFRVTSEAPQVLVQAGISKNQSIDEIWKTLCNQYDDKLQHEWNLKNALNSFPTIASFYDTESFSKAVEKTRLIDALLSNMPEGAGGRQYYILQEIAKKCYEQLRIKITNHCETIQQVTDMLLKQFKNSMKNSSLMADAEVPKPSRGRNDVRIKQVRTLETSPFDGVICNFCNGTGHYTDNCSANISDEVKKQAIIDKKLCFNCLRSGHSSSHCYQRRFVCVICNGPHKSHLHSVFVLFSSSRSSNQDSGSEQSSHASQYSHASQTSQYVPLMNRSGPTGYQMRPRMNPRFVSRPPPPVRPLQYMRPPPNIDPPIVNSSGATNSSANQDSGRHINLVSAPRTIRLSKDPRPIGIIACNDVQTKVLLDTGAQASIASGEYLKTAEKRKVEPVKLLPYGDSEPIWLDTLTDISVRCLDGSFMIFEAFIHREEGSNELLIGSDQLDSLIGKELRTPIGVFRIGYDKDPVSVEIVQLSADLSDEEVDQESEMSVVLEDNRFVASLPFLNEHRPPQNFDAALRLLESSQKRLGKSQLLETYEGELMKYVENDHAVEVEDTSGHFLPHHAVIREQAESTKCRIVFNGSFGKDSLNKTIFKGVSRGLHVFDKLLKFRSKRFVFLADIEKAFLQIKIRSDHQRFLKFIWRDASQVLRIFQFTSLPFGLAASPAILTKCTELVAEQLSPNTQKLLKNSIYMDDIILCSDDATELDLAAKETTEKFNKVGFQLHKCVSNLPSDKSKKIVNPKVLGLKWDQESDSISIPIPVKNPSPASKRMILSVLGSIFDPLGLLDPIKLKLKKILSVPVDSLDSILPPEHIITIENFCAQMPLLESWAMPRWCHGDTLLCFCDASEAAYGFCIFVGDSASGSMTMLCAKSKIVPSSPVRTIPELELLSLHLMMKEIPAISKILEISKIKIFSDSIINLHRLNQLPNNFRAFTSAKLFTIQKIASALCVDFFHVSSKLNPADFYSRSIDIPQFLQLPSLFSRDIPCHQDSFKFVKIYANQARPVIKKWANFDALISTDLLKTVNRARRFLDAVRRFRRGRVPYVKPNFKDGVRLLVTWQQNCYSSEDLKVEIYAKQEVFHIRTRMPSFNPVWIPKESFLVPLIIRWKHVSNLHAGVDRTVAEICKDFYIVGIRKLVKTEIKFCRFCIIAKGKAISQPMGRWPESRYHFARAFENISVDHFGPLILQNRSKVWVLISVCLACRAIRLEVVNSLSAAANLQAFENIFARTGRPRQIYSDNGTAFKRLAKDLKALRSLAEELTSDSIQWHFSPPLAPWFNSTAERFIGTVKRAMSATSSKFKSGAELRCLLLQVENIVNNRVLFYDEEDQPITPNMLSRNSASRSLLDEDPALQSPSRFWAFIQQERKSFSDRFRKNYLNHLAVCPSSAPAQLISVGDILLVPDPAFKGRNFTKGIVQQIFPGPDKVVRVVQILTKHGSFRRAVQGMVKLEVRPQAEHVTK